MRCIGRILEELSSIYTALGEHQHTETEEQMSLGDNKMWRDIEIEHQKMG
jgi:hypothetical protein